MLTVIVADDEKIARRRLVRLIEETGEAEIVAACAGGREAVEQTLTLQPRLLFLDVQMPDLDGFGVLREIAGKASPATSLRDGVRPIRRARIRRPRRGLPAQAIRHRALSRGVRRAKDRLQGDSRAADDERIRALLSDYVARNKPQNAQQPLDRVAVKVDGVLKIVARPTSIGGRPTATTCGCTSVAPVTSSA